MDTDTDEQLVQYYLDWTEDAIQELAGHIQTAHTAPESDTVQKIYEITHNIKGMGTSFGFPLMTEAGRSLCGYLRARGDKAPDHSVLDAHLKSFRLVLTKRMMGDGGAVGRDLVGRLNQLVEHLSNA
ncbi:MAG: Hpt domain-containing protein [Pseudomonadota bacterium]